MSRLILVSFADNRYRRSLERLEKQTSEYPFDKRYFLTEKTCLTKKYWRNLKPWIYRRGFGYWSWKPLIVKEIFSKMNDGDILFWIDAGLSWNATPKAHERFSQYVSMLRDDNELVVFKQNTIEQEWTKGDVLNVLDVYNNKDICESPQFYGGIFLVKKTKTTCKLFDKLHELYQIDKELITDKKSTCPNKINFKQHRHDQSIFSVVVKQIPHVSIPWYEVMPKDGNWDNMEMYPIHGHRLKEKDRPISEVIKNKLLRPWRMILDIYFKKFRNYEYSGNYVW